MNVVGPLLIWSFVIGMIRVRPFLLGWSNEGSVEIGLNVYILRVVRLMFLLSRLKIEGSGLKYHLVVNIMMKGSGERKRVFKSSRLIS